MILKLVLGCLIILISGGILFPYLQNSLWWLMVLIPIQLFGFNLVKESLETCVDI